MDGQTKEKGTKGQRDKRTKQQRDKGTQGQWDKGMDIFIFPTKGQRGQGINGLMDRRTKGQRNKQMQEKRDKYIKEHGDNGTMTQKGTVWQWDKGTNETKGQ